VNRQLWPLIGLLLAGAILALGTCLARPEPPTPPATETPTEASPQVTSAPSAMPERTATVPPSPAPGFQVLWTLSTKGPIWGTPAVDEGTVYLTSDDGNLYAVDAQDGGVKWQFATQGIVRSRPALAAGLVYIASDDGYLYAVDAQSGEQAWRTDIGNAMPRDQRERLGTTPNPTTYDYWQSSPVVADGRVYAGSLDGSVYALAGDTGEIVWTCPTGAKVRATPTVEGGTVYIGSWDKSVYALDAASGRVRWQTPIGGQVQTNALVAGDLVYCASRKASVVALSAQTGEKVWEYGYGDNMWVESSPRLVDGVLYIGSSGTKIVAALDGRTGDLVAACSSRAFNWSTPAIAGDWLYIGGTSFRHEDRDGLFAIRLVDGGFGRGEGDVRFLPVKETLEAAGNWSGVASSPVVVDGAIYFGGLDGKLYAVSPQ
jgi:outer membrane protein assembly factor BamB